MRQIGVAIFANVLVVCPLWILWMTFGTPLQLAAPRTKDSLTSSQQGTLAQLEFLDQVRKQHSRESSDTGGWRFYHGAIDKNSIVYSFGLGTDISFDEYLIKHFGCHVHGFDNTPVHSAWWLKKRHALPSDTLSHFHRHEFLLGAVDGDLQVGLPAGHLTSYAVSSASAKGFTAGRNVKLPARTLATLMSSLQHARVDVCKVDIEGAEFDIFQQMARASGADSHPFPVCQLLIEFHSRLVPLGYAAKAEAIIHLESLGFALIHNVVMPDGADNALFVNPSFCKI